MSWTYPPKHIVVPVDFGEASGRAVRVAAGLAAHFGAQLDVLHVEALDAPPYFTHEQVKALQAQQTNARAQALRYLEKFAERHGAGGATATIVEGSPAEEILKRGESADLIVMGTNDRGIAARWWLGSVAERVSRQAELPVLVVRASGPDDASAYLPALEKEAARRRQERE